LPAPCSPQGFLNSMASPVPPNTLSPGLNCRHGRQAQGHAQGAAHVSHAIAQPARAAPATASRQQPPPRTGQQSGVAGSRREALMAGRVKGVRRANRRHLAVCRRLQHNARDVLAQDLGNFKEGHHALQRGLAWHQSGSCGLGPQNNSNNLVGPWPRLPEQQPAAASPAGPHAHAHVHAHA